MWIYCYNEIGKKSNKFEEVEQLIEKNHVNYGKIQGSNSIGIVESLGKNVYHG